MKKYIIDFEPTATDDDINAYLTSNNCTVVKIFDKFGKVYLVQKEDTENTPQMLQTSSIITHLIDDDALEIRPLSLTPVVLQTHDTVTLPVDDQKEWWKIYSCIDLDLAQETVPVPIHKSNNIIYLIDSGIDETHPEFVGKRIEKLFSVTGQFNDCSGHGTALASVMTGVTCSLTDCVVKVVKIFDDTFATKQSDLLHAFDAIITDALLNLDKILIANMSWSIPRNTYIEGKIKTLVAVGVEAVVSAGNSGLPIEDVTPAAMKEVVTVGSYNHEFKPSNFSDYGGTSVASVTPGETNYGELDGWAPGENIWVATLGGAYGYIAGTSVAAAVHSACFIYNSVEELEGINKAAYFQGIPGFAYRQLINSFRRVGLLDLSDPKYVNSPNKITTYFNVYPPEYHQQPLTDAISLLVRTGEVDLGKFFIPTITAGYEPISELPDWITIIGCMIRAAPNFEPTSAVGVDQLDYQFRIHPLVGDPIIRTVHIIVLSSTFNVDNLPPDDPLIPITQLAPCTKQPPFPSCYTSSRCGVAGTFCNGDGSAKTYTCVCSS